MSVTMDKTTVLWKEFAASRSMELRNELVLHYIPLVKNIVLRMVPTYKRHVDFDDLMSCGVLGLMDAIDKFDPEKQVKFETYATLRIKGEIIDQIRKQDWAPISLRQKIKKIEDGFSSLELQYGRTATEEEVATHLSLDIGDVRKTLDESHTFNMVYLDELLTDRIGGDDSLESADGSPEQSFEGEELKEVLAQNIDALSERERQVVSLYYFEELTLKEIGLVLGVSESRVSQIHSKALMTLKVKLQKAFNM